MRRLPLLLALLLLSACGQAAPPAGVSTAIPQRMRAIDVAITPVHARLEGVATPTQDAPLTAVPRAPQDPAAAPNPDLAILRYGWSQAEHAITVAFVVQNTTDQISYERIPYRITMYDDHHHTVGDALGTVMLLLPGTTLGMTTHGQATATVTAIDVVVGGGKSSITAKPATAIFTTQSRITTTAFPLQVTGVLTNNLVRTVSQVQVSAIAYGADETIIGGGAIMLPTLMASSAMAVTVPLLTTTVPTRVELWASFTPESFAHASP